MRLLLAETEDRDIYLGENHCKSFEEVLPAFGYTAETVPKFRDQAPDVDLAGTTDYATPSSSSAPIPPPLSLPAQGAVIAETRECRHVGCDRIGPVATITKHEGKPHVDCTGPLCRARTTFLPRHLATAHSELERVPPRMSRPLQPLEWEILDAVWVTRGSFYGFLPVIQNLMPDLTVAQIHTIIDKHQNRWLTMDRAALRPRLEEMLASLPRV